jgi:hypothetical protein
MGTRSDIIVHRADGKWARIYCHWDGYIENNGNILHEHYTTQDKADALMALGDLSSLGPEIGKKHDFDWRTKMTPKLTAPKGARAKAANSPKFKAFEAMCLVYGRDRGETGTEAKLGDSLAAVWPDDDCGTEFTYVFCDPDESGVKRWFVGEPDEGKQTLRDLGAVIRGEDEAPKTAVKAFGGNFVIGHR